MGSIRYPIYIREYVYLATISIAILRWGFGRMCYYDAACGKIPGFESANKA